MLAVFRIHVILTVVLLGLVAWALKGLLSAKSGRQCCTEANRRSPWPVTGVGGQGALFRRRFYGVRVLEAWDSSFDVWPPISWLSSGLIVLRGGDPFAQYRP